jgi:hypothetical protein
MFGACPQCFMAMSLPRALAAVVALNVTPVALAVESIRRSSASITFVLGTVVLGLACSVVFGTWVVKIIEQSRERAQLISRLEAAQAELAQVSGRSSARRRSRPTCCARPASSASRTGPPRWPRPSGEVTFPRPAGNRPYDHNSVTLLAP